MVGERATAERHVRQAEGLRLHEHREVGPGASLVSVGLQKEGRPGPLTQADPALLGSWGKKGRFLCRAPTCTTT